MRGRRVVEDVRGANLGTVEPIQSTVKIVGAGFGSDLYYAAAGAAKLGRRSAGRRLELGDIFDRREDHERVDQRLVVVNAIDYEVVGLRRQTVDSQCRSAGIGIPPSFRIIGRSARIVGVLAAAHAGSEQSQHSKVAAIERQIDDLVSFDDFAGR